MNNEPNISIKDNKKLHKKQPQHNNQAIGTCDFDKNT